MNTKFIRSNFLPLGFFSALALTALPFSIAPARAQTTNPTPAATTPAIVADGNLAEYTLENAPVLNRGTVAPAVADVQLFLQQLGFYKGPIDSIYGPQTYSGVTTFQRSRNLTANGTIGRETWQSLLDAYNRRAPVAEVDLNKYSPNSAPILRMGSEGEAVRDVQAFLKQKGFYTGAINGVYGPATATAVEAFQQRYASLRNDGIVGPRTWSAMIN